MIHLDFTITFNTHRVRVRKYRDGTIRCFKYTETQCDIERFTDDYEAGDYLYIPFKKELELINR